jgi:hypothetical protein
LVGMLGIVSLSFFFKVYASYNEYSCQLSINIYHDVIIYMLTTGSELHTVKL